MVLRRFVEAEHIQEVGHVFREVEEVEKLLVSARRIARVEDDGAVGVDSCKGRGGKVQCRARRVADGLLDLDPVRWESGKRPSGHVRVVAQRARERSEAAVWCRGGRS